MNQTLASGEAATGTGPSTPDIRAVQGRGRQALRQGGVLVAQLSAGVGNLAFLLVSAHLLPPGQFAQLAAFLAVYLLLHTVAAAAAPAVALDPGLEARLRSQALATGLGLGTAVALTASWTSEVTGLSVTTLLALGAAAPGATLLALARGRLYGEERGAAVAVTLLTEPLARVLFGIGLAVLLRPQTAVWGVVAAGYAALAVAVLTARAPAPPGSGARPQLSPGLPALTAATLLGVAVVGSQDVIFANRLLPDASGALFAAVSTLGAMVFFATSTVPLVMLPQAVRRDPGALLTATSLTGGLSALAVAALSFAPASLYGLLLGERYIAAHELAVPYLCAMAALGLSRVLLAHLCATGSGRRAFAITLLAVALQAVLVVMAGSAAEVVTATTVASCALLVSAVAAVMLRTPVVLPETVAAPVDIPGIGGGAHRAARLLSWRRRLGAALPLATIILVAVALRAYVTRSVWIDEAISIRQASQPYGAMLSQLAANDVHPPLYHSLLWAVVHLSGSDGEAVVRLPSMVVGTLLVPVFFVVARDLWDRRTGLVAAVVVAVAPVAVWYSQEARMYALWMLLATLLIWLQAKLWRGDRGWRLWAGLALAGAASLWTQWFAVLPLAVGYLVLLGHALARWRAGDGPRRLLALLTSASATVALVLPIVPIGLAQAERVLGGASAGSGAAGQTGSAASQAVAGAPDVYAALANVIWAVWGYHSDEQMVLLSALWPVIALLALALLGRGRSREVTLLVAVAGVPFLVMFALGFVQRNFFELRYFTATVPALLLLLARLSATWGRSRLTAAALPALLVVSMAAGLVDQQVNRSNPRIYDFRGAITWAADRGEGDDLLLFAPSWLSDELHYYSPGMRTRAIHGPVAPPSDGTRVFVLGSFLDDPATSGAVGDVLAQLRNAGARLVARHKVANVEVWEFA
ncbi:MAG: mannosyltransferase [Actinomycetota bacterium]|nr:mannosyltransferase [Actinomycetota bacterium]